MDETFSRVSLRFKSQQVEAEFTAFYSGPNNQYLKIYATLLAVVNIIVHLYCLDSQPAVRSTPGQALPPATELATSAPRRVGLPPFGSTFLLPYSLAALVHAAIVPLLFVSRLQRYHGRMYNLILFTHWPTYSLAQVMSPNQIPSLFSLAACSGMCGLLGRLRFCIAVFLAGIYPCLFFSSVVIFGWAKEYAHSWRALYLLVYFGLMTATTYVSELAWRRSFIRHRRLTGEMALFVAETQKSERLIGTLFPASVVRALASSPGFMALTRSYEDAVVIATDVVSFTTFCSRVSSRDVVDFLNLVFARFDSLSHVHGLEKVHTIGDAVIFVLLPPPILDKASETTPRGKGIVYASESRESDIDLPSAAGATPSRRAARAIVFGLRLLDCFGQILREVQPRFPPPTGMRAGLHSGCLLGAFVGGSHSRLQFDVFGEAMDGAASLETSGRAGMLQVSQRAWSLATRDPGWPRLKLAPERGSGLGGAETWLVSPVACPPDICIVSAEEAQDCLQLDSATSKAAFANLALLCAERERNEEATSDLVGYAAVEDFSTGPLHRSLRYRDPRTDREFRRFLLSPHSASFSTLAALPRLALPVAFGILCLAPLNLRNGLLCATMLVGNLALHATGRRLVRQASAGKPPHGLWLFAYVAALVVALLPGFFASPWDSVAHPLSYQGNIRLVEMASLSFISIFVQFVVFIRIEQRVLLHVATQVLWALAALVSPQSYFRAITAPYHRAGYLAMAIFCYIVNWLLVGLFLEYSFRRDFQSFCQLQRHKVSVQSDYLRALVTVLQLMLPQSVLNRMQPPPAQAANHEQGLTLNESTILPGSPQIRDDAKVPLVSRHTTSHNRQGNSNSAARNLAALRLRRATLSGPAASFLVEDFDEPTGKTGSAVVDDVSSATCLCLKLAGLSALAAQEVAPCLQRVWRAVDPVIHEASATQDIFKVKSVGPMALIVAGALRPTAAAEHCCAAVALAHRLVQTLQHFAATDTALTFTMGMHCGPLTGAVLGTSLLSYDVFGDTVNIASRMQSTAPANSVQVTAAVADIMGEELFKLRGEVEVKGRGTMLTHLLAPQAMSPSSVVPQLQQSLSASSSAGPGVRQGWS